MQSKFQLGTIWILSNTNKGSIVTNCKMLQKNLFNTLVTNLIYRGEPKVLGSNLIVSNIFLDLEPKWT